MCSSHDIVKQDGYYVCQNCGTKYTTEDAKKLIVEVAGKVDVSGSAVKIDSSDSLNNYRQLARRARESGDVVNAVKYYEMVAVKDLNDWEAAFFPVYYQAAETNIAGIVNSANRVTNTLEPVCKLILKDPSMSNGEVRKSAVRLMSGYVKSLCEAFVRSPTRIIPSSSASKAQRRIGITGYTPHSTWPTDWRCCRIRILAIMSLQRSCSGTAIITPVLA